MRVEADGQQFSLVVDFDGVFRLAALSGRTGDAELVLFQPHLDGAGALIGELRDAAAFGSWIATIARNRATDYLRQTRAQVALPDELPGGDPIEAETLVVLDDQLVQSDDLKLDWFRTALLELAEKVQVLIFTCRPADYPSGGPRTARIDLDRCIARRPA